MSHEASFSRSCHSLFAINYELSNAISRDAPTEPHPSPSQREAQAGEEVVVVKGPII